MAGEAIYAQPRVVHDLHDCYFYHTVDVPGHGCVQGHWDLRHGVDRYLNYDHFAGKRVLDVGFASGYLSFHMEKQGAEVVSFDLSASDGSWDVVPFAGTSLPQTHHSLRKNLERIQNSYWLCHRLSRSRARAVYGTVYNIPAALGPVDVAVCGNLLLHLRDPFLALQNVCALTRETVIVADLIPRRMFPRWMLARYLGPLGSRLFGNQLRFLPSYRNQGSSCTWWYLTPEIVRQFLDVLGFERTRVSYHRQHFEGAARLMYTVVGQRTKPAAVVFDDAARGGRGVTSEPSLGSVRDSRVPRMSAELPTPPNTARFPWWVLPWAVLLACVYLPSLTTRFDFNDDTITAYPWHVKSLAGFCHRVWSTTLYDFNVKGPFRPVAWSCWAAESELFAGDPVLWRMARLGWTAISAAVLLWLLCEVGIRPTIAVGTAALAMWNPYRGDVWVSLTFSEGLAMPFAVLALIVARRAARSSRPWGWDLAGMALMLLALGSKNVFAAVVPAQMFLRIAPDGVSLRQGLKQHGRRACLLALTLILPATHYMLFRLNWREDQCLTEAPWAQPWEMTRALAGAVSLGFMAPGLIVASAALAAAWLWRNRRLEQLPLLSPPPWPHGVPVRQRYRAALVAGLLLLAGGIGVHVLHRGVSGHYTLPAAWGADLWIAVLLNCLAEIPLLTWKRAALATLGGGLAAVLIANVGRQDRVAARIDLLWQTLEWVEQSAPPGACIGWVSTETPKRHQPDLTVREGMHFLTHLHCRGRRDLLLQPLDPLGSPLPLENLPAAPVPPRLLISAAAQPPAAGTWQLVGQISHSYWAGVGTYRCYLWTQAHSLTAQTGAGGFR